MRDRQWTGRGRPRGNCHSHFDTRILEYLVELSLKHEINTTEFFDAVVRAWNNGKATCLELTINFRKKKEDSAIFLITKGFTVVAQLPIPEYILKEADPLSGFDYIRERARNASERRDRKTLDISHMQIKDLKLGMRKINLRAQVTEISKPKQVVTRFNDYAVLANATLSDKTSTIKLPLWNEQINWVSINDTVQIENANVIVFRGEKQLRIGRRGTLKIVETPPHTQQNTLQNA
jgi:hypothetical protein